MRKKCENTTVEYMITSSFQIIFIFVEGYDIPHNAIYEFNAYLVIVYNDTNKIQPQGMVSFSVTGVGSFTFK